MVVRVEIGRGGRFLERVWNEKGEWLKKEFWNGCRGRRIRKEWLESRKEESILGRGSV